ncbi:MAG TPA: dockerin type I repeat-containing protein, partial [Thermoanaerobaculia bacterium]|nr:dockerin type I repeat-containing protein [Thermoanaerobaculia bacterium]
TTSTQDRPAVTASGNGFLVAWQSLQDGEYGIYAQRFGTGGQPSGGEFRANTFHDTHFYPSVGADSSGAFVIAWNILDDDGLGVFARRFASTGAPLAAEFRVNTYTTGSQLYPSVAELSGGGFVVAWQGPGDGNVNGVFAQRFSTAGAPVGGEVLVNAFTSNSQSSVALAPGLGGGYVAVWSSPGQDGSSDGVFGQQVVLSPPTDTDDLRVNTYTTSFQGSASIAIGPSGFVIVWTSLFQDGSDNGVFAQCFGPGGAPVGAEFRANTYTTGSERAGKVAFLANGEFVVAFARIGGGQSEIQGQRFAATGAPLGGEFRVNSVTTSAEVYPVVAGNAGGFVVAWQSNADDPSGDVHAQRFSAAGAPLGGEFRVNTYTSSSQKYSSVGLSSSGEFVVVWHSYKQVSNYDVFGQRFDATGRPLGEEFQVNTSTTHAQLLPKAAVDPAGNFVVIWGSSTGTEYEVFAQRFAASGQPLGSEFQVNTNPTGITTRFQGQTIADVAANDSGFTVVWNSPASAHNGVFGQRFGAGGERIGPEFRVNASTSSSNLGSIAEDANGSFIVVYELTSGASGNDVYRRRFSALLPGDVDGNGVVNVADVFYLINFLFAGGPDPIGAADVDGSGGPGVADVFYLINFLFAGGPAPV